VFSYGGQQPQQAQAAASQPGAFAPIKPAYSSAPQQQLQQQQQPGQAVGGYPAVSTPQQPAVYAGPGFQQGGGGAAAAGGGYAGYAPVAPAGSPYAGGYAGYPAQGNPYTRMPAAGYVHPQQQQNQANYK
jgi:hypothetical protein